MEWYRSLYLGEDAKKKKNRIIRRIKRQAGMIDVYLITLPTNDRNLLDIVPSYMLLQKYHWEHCPMIVGLADGYQEALEVVQEIIGEVYGQTGAFAVERYLTEQNQR